MGIGTICLPLGHERGNRFDAKGCANRSPSTRWVNVDASDTFVRQRSDRSALAKSPSSRGLVGERQIEHSLRRERKDSSPASSHRARQRYSAEPERRRSRLLFPLRSRESGRMTTDTFL